MRESAGYAYGAYTSDGNGSTHSYLLPELLKALGPPRGPILDLGCGNGWVAGELAKSGFDVYGVDASPSGISVAQSRAPGRFFQMNVDAGVLPQPLQAIQFDTVISTEVIEHLYAPELLVRLARRILAHKQGRRLILTTPYHGYLKNVALALSGKMDSHFTALWEGGHIKFFSRATLEKLLRKEGFTPTGFSGAGRAPLLWKSMVITAAVE